VFANTQVPVRVLFDNLENGPTVDPFVDWLPGVPHPVVESVHGFAATSLDHEFHAAYAAVSRHVTDRYAVVIEVAEIQPPFKGDLDGQRIRLGRDNTPEERLFLVAHLFGHTVQWNTCEESRRLGMTRPENPDARMLDRLEAYEREACGYSQQALHEAGVTSLDQWLADYSACDLAYLRHAYTTGERRSFRGFWRPGCPLIEPRAIPAFSPRRWRIRDQAIVI